MCKTHTELWVSYYVHEPDSLYFSEVHQGIFIQAKAERRRSHWAFWGGKVTICSWNEIGDQDISNFAWFMKKMEKPFFFSGSSTIDCWRGVEKKMDTSKSEVVPMCSGEFQGLKKSKESNLEGSHFHLSPGLVRGFLQLERGSICLLYCSKMAMSVYYCQSLECF